jgi:hypothetical protein
MHAVDRFFFDTPMIRRCKNDNDVIGWGNVHVTLRRT